MKKIISLIALILVISMSFFPHSVHADNIDNPHIESQSVIRWGNSSYHDSLGARDPFVVKNQGTYYLYYDCQEDLLNPSFESNIGTNGWETWNGTAVATTEKKLFGSQSLKITNTGTEGGGAYTGNYYYGAKTEANLAMFTGLEVTPNTTYIASVSVWANQGNTAQIIVQQYRDDPYGNYSQNVISDKTSKATVTGNGNWQRLSTKFTTSPTTTAITLSLVPGLNQTSYWDGVQLERVTGAQSTPTDFPTGVWFNYSLPDVIGWKTCLATSTDSINFQKHGMIYLGGARSVWETKEKPGWVGSSGIYMSPFFYNGSWYSYTWVAGYQLGVDSYTQDPGGQNHRPWYGDRRAYLPNGNPTRSGLVRSPSLGGPWERISQSGPQILPSSTWGQTYVSANGVPQLLGNQWVLFLAGVPGSTFNWRTITPGLATSSTPLGPWAVTGYSPLLPPNDQNVVPEGPIYYKDKSGKHVMFINDISGGDALAYWTDNPLAPWVPANRKTIVEGAQGGTVIGLSTVVEKDDQTLLVYYANRPPSGASNPWKQYLFHDIGLATISLPLFGAPTPTPTPTPIPIPTATPSPTPAPIPKPGDANGDGKVDGVDYVIWLNHYNQSVSGASSGDFNNSGKVDGVDYVVWLNNYGR